MRARRLRTQDTAPEKGAAFLPNPGTILFVRNSCHTCAHPYLYHTRCSARQRKHALWAWCSKHCPAASSLPCRMHTTGCDTLSHSCNAARNNLKFPGQRHICRVCPAWNFATVHMVSHDCKFVTLPQYTWSTMTVKFVMMNYADNAWSYSRLGKTSFH